MTVQYNKRIGQVKLNARGTFTYATNRVISNGDPFQEYGYRDTKGKKQWQQFGYKSLGLFTSMEEINNSPTQFSEAVHSTLQPGDIKYKDINGDGLINENDQIPIGLADVPEIFYGLGFTLNWKGFDLSAFFQGVGRVTQFEKGDALTPFSVTTMELTGFLEEVYHKRWSNANPDPNAKYPRVNGIAYADNNNTKQSDFWQRDGSYLRLRNLEFGYTLPSKWTKKMHLRTVRVYFSGVNLWTLSSEITAYDPELGTGDGRAYPLTKVFSLGVNVSF